ncbi:GNAT family N-acetyltransferase [Microbacterium sp. BWT-B31]|uniref:GNAT family N-acetyltransferase n=1 Tax=Microbacterium sp. BWT-B31 TaxID=3232072 RepID=UPI0035283894
MPEPTTTAKTTVRPAVATDSGDVARVQVQGWHEAYTGRMPQAILDGLDVESSEPGWRRTIEDGPSRYDTHLWVAQHDGVVVGFVCAGPGRDDDGVPGRREVYAIYVLAEHYGSGAGQALLDAAIGDDAASLWVLEDNPRARAFYARNRLVPDGAVKDDDRWGEPIREVRLVRGAAG